MVWEWSHTQEAYDNVKENINSLSVESKHEIYAEWMAFKCVNAEDDGGGPWCNICYNYTAHHSPDKMPSDIEQVIYDYAEEAANCDNGGFDAWVCPYGCHTVPFGKTVYGDPKERS